MCFKIALLRLLPLLYCNKARFNELRELSLNIKRMVKQTYLKFGL